MNKPNSQFTVLSNFDIIKICEILDLPLIFCSFKDLIFDVPKNNRRNKFYIINLDNTNGIGTHWTCLSTFDNYIYYFDSFGLPPPTIIKKFTNSIGEKKLYYNDYQYQSENSTICGWFCIGWLHHLYNCIIMGLPLDETIYRFLDLGFDIDKQENKNYKILLKYINRII